MGAHLIAEIGADTSGFEAGLRRAEHHADHYGKEIAKKLNHAFGAGLLIATAIEGTKKLFEQAEKISEGAAKLHVTTDEYQMLTAAAKDAGMETEEFVKSNAKNGVMLDALVGKMGKYRGAVEMTHEKISDLKELSEGAKAFGKGMINPLAATGIFLGKVAMSGLDLAGAGISAMMEPFGRTLIKGQDSGDLLASAGARFGIGPQDTGSAALKLPSGLGQTAKFKRLTENLRMLNLQEDSLKDSAAMRSSIWNPQLTDRQQGGAFVARNGLIVDENGNREIVKQLEENRKEQQRTTEEISKLRSGE